MKLKNIFKVLLCSGTLALSLQAKESADAISERAYKVEDGKSFEALVTMDLMEDHGTVKTHQMTILKLDEGELEKIRISIVLPKLLLNTVFLSHSSPLKNSEQWIYMPSLRKTRKIASSSKEQSFIGTDFTYEDLGKRPLFLDDYKILKTEKCFEGSCYLLEAKAKNPNENISKRILSVRTDNYIVVKADFYSSEGKLVKQFTVQKIATIHGIATITQSLMEDFKLKSKTLLKVESIKYNLPLNETLFKSDNLSR